MSTIYENTVMALVLDSLCASITELVMEWKCGKWTRETYGKAIREIFSPINFTLTAIAAVSIIEMILNKGYTKKELVCDKKVFFSGSQATYENCSVEQKEFNYIDFAAKVSSIGLAVVDYLTEFKYGKYLSLVPACSAFVAEKVADLYEWDYENSEIKLTDTHGLYIEVEL